MAGTTINHRLARLEAALLPPPTECKRCGFPTVVSKRRVLCDTLQNGDGRWKIGDRCAACGRLLDWEGRSMPRTVGVVVIRLGDDPADAA